MPSSSFPNKVIFLIFPQFNTLDMNGPLEVLCKSGLSEHFGVDVAADRYDAEGLVTSSEGVRVKPDIYITEEFMAAGRLEAYDIMIIAGGPTDAVEDISKSQDKSILMRTIEEFFRMSTSNCTSGKIHTPRILLSICTASIFVGALGIFDECDKGLCTTHWSSYDSLQEAIMRGRRWRQQRKEEKSSTETVNSESARVIKARYVDSGIVGRKEGSRGVRIMSSGGVSCGIDAALHVVTLQAGEEEARNTAQFLDYSWKYTNGVVFV